MDWTMRPVCLGRWQLLSRVQVLSIGRDSRGLHAESIEFWQRVAHRGSWKGVCANITLI